MSYTFGEVRKVATAGGGLVATVLAYILADNTLRGLIPPQWIALLTGIVTVIGVFKVPNAEKPPTPESFAKDLGRVLASTQAARDLESTAQATAAAATQQVKSIETALVSALGPVGGTIVTTLADKVDDAINRAKNL